MRWEEPISRPKGRAREDVLIAALEDVLRETCTKNETDRKASEQARTPTYTLHTGSRPQPKAARPAAATGSEC